MALKLFVGNLSYEVTESELNDLFAAFGEVVSVKIITDRLTGNSKGFGFVEMSTRQEAEQAIQGLNGKTVRNRSIVVSEARPPLPRGGFGGPSRGGYGGGHRPQRGIRGR